MPAECNVESLVRLALELVLGRPTSRRVMGMVEEDITNLWDLAPAVLQAWQLELLAWKLCQPQRVR